MIKTDTGKKYTSVLWFLAAVVSVLAVTCFPFVEEGLYGYEPDILYHLNRVEGVVGALRSFSYPAAIYPDFFGGLGYGSPLFYPDLLLVIPAALRLLGASPLLAYKLTCALFSIFLAVSAFFSFNYIVKNPGLAAAGTLLFSLSQFVLADLIVRAGFSSFISMVFLPPLVAGLFDFFYLNGRKTWLMGFSLGGLVLTHILNTFLAILTVVIVFIARLLTRDGRRVLSDKTRLMRLAMTAGFTLALTAWFWAPMLEQMASGADFVYMHPWADISEFTQPWQEFFSLTGYFFNIAHVGVGVPILLFAAIRLLASGTWDSSGRFGDMSYILGLFMLAAMTDILPWKLLSRTIMNNLQFTFRIYPYALIFLVTGIICSVKRFDRDRWLPFCVAAIVLSMIFGVIQNMTVIENPDGFHKITVDILHNNSFEVGRGEWLPASFDPEASVEKTVKLKFSEGERVRVEYRKEPAKPAGEFDIDNIPSGAGEIIAIVPQIWYKGYRAVLTDSSGEKHGLNVSESTGGLLEVAVDTGLTGTVRVYYGKTPCQIAALILSLAALFMLIVYMRRGASFSRVKNDMSDGRESLEEETPKNTAGNDFTGSDSGEK